MALKLLLPKDKENVSAKHVFILNSFENQINTLVNDLKSNVREKNVD